MTKKIIETREALADALRVMVLGHRPYFELHDPKALQQAETALKLQDDAETAWYREVADVLEIRVGGAHVLSDTPERVWERHRRAGVSPSEAARLALIDARC